MDEPVLSIGELAERTGLTVATLRAWERRHGFPVPQRLPSGHRRYTRQDAAALHEVLRVRHQGSSLEGALTTARERAGAARSSLMATLRRALPDVAPAALSRAALLAISRAIEDEVAARADRPVLVGAFQLERHLRRAADRWEDLASTSLATLTFARPESREPRPVAWDVRLGPADPLSREWAVVCDSPAFAACLVGVERPPAVGRRGPRTFEALWTVEARAVREAARTAVALAGAQHPTLPELLGRRLQEPAYSTHETVRGATALATRVIAYLDR